MIAFFATTTGIVVVAGIVVCIAIVALVALWITLKNRRTLHALCAGANGAALEDIIMHTNEKVAAFDNDIQELFAISNTIHKHAHKSVHRVGLIRFNPFRDYSGNQSFALALLNTGGNGVVISSIHTREGTRVYTKEIKKGAPVNNELTEEEKQAIAAAQ